MTDRAGPSTGAGGRPSTTTAWARLKILLDEALGLPSEERQEWLESLSPADRSLRAELEDLLASDEVAEEILSGSGGDASEGRRIGPYRLQGLIGQGGMGSVYRAVRADDQFEQVVALKLLRFLNPDRALRQRFQAERQILARLEHPNVARLLDGGTEGGQPYFVMEHVAGRTIERYCAEERLDLRARLRMFLDVCAAVQYAHRNLVVHRDLKPGNVLVDAEGRPKLLDFGIAKLLEASPAGEAATATLGQAMTPEYASPEQVAGGPIGTSSDVYSLGVLLYELLAGRRPYEIGQLPPAERLRVIGSVDPPPPSVAVASLVRPTTRRTARRGSDTAETLSSAACQAAFPEPPERWSRQIRGDLDTIVAMALRKEPERRYPSAEALAEDLRRFLERRPVRAQRDTWSYRLSRFVDRNRWPVASAVLLAVSLAGGVGATIWQKRRAEQRFEDVRTLAHAFIFDVHDAVAPLPGSTAARGLIVATGVRYLDRLAADAGDNASLLEELARGYQRLGDVAGGPGQPNRGDIGAALANYEKAVSLRRRLVAGNQTAPRVAALMDALAALGRAHLWAGDKAAARASFEEALALPSTLGPDGARRLRREMADANFGLGSLLLRDGRSDEALTHLGRAVDLALEEHQAAPEDLVSTELLAKASVDLALALQRSGRRPEAARVYAADAPLWETLRAARPGSLAYRRGQAVFLSNYASLCEVEGLAEESVRLARQTVEEFEQLATLDPLNAGAQRDLLMANVRLANAATTARQHPTAIAAGRRAVELGEALSTRDPHDLGADRDRFLAGSTLAEALLDAGQPGEAVPLERRLLAWATARLEHAPGQAYAEVDVAYAEEGLGRALLQSRRAGEALEHLGTSCRRFSTLLDRDPGNAEAVDRLAEELALLGDAHRALADGADGPRHRARETQAYRAAADLAQRLEARGALAPHAAAWQARLKQLLAHAPAVAAVGPVSGACAP